MTPKQAYDDVAQRARRLYRLLEGLVNTRKYRIRRDWGASFCKLMHWRSHAAIGRVDSRHAVIVLRDPSDLTPADFDTAALDDLLRSALALSVSALDRYIHERVVKRIVKALRRRTLVRQQQELTIPALVSVRMAETTVKGLRTKKPFRPANTVRKALQEVLHKRPFQSWREIDYAFNLIGITNLETQLQRAYRVRTLKPVRAQLNSIAGRRNRIVHEGDLIRHARGGTVRRHPISPKYVRDSLDFVDTLVLHLETVT